MKAIVINDDTFSEIGKYLQDEWAMDRLKAWYRFMGGTFSFSLFFVTKMELENGAVIPARAMPWTRLTTDFDGVWGNKGDWFEITPKQGKEMYL